MLGIRSDFSEDAIDGNRHSVFMEEVAGVCVEYRDAAGGLIEENGILFSYLKIAKRKVAEVEHLGRHLIGSGGLAFEVWVGDDEAWFGGIEIAFHADIVAELPVLEYHAGEILKWEEFTGENAAD